MFDISFEFDAVLFGQGVLLLFLLLARPLLRGDDGGTIVNVEKEPFGVPLCCTAFQSSFEYRSVCSSFACGGRVRVSAIQLNWW